MALPPTRICPQRSQASPASFPAAEAAAAAAAVLRKKLAALAAHHAQVKIAYQQLHSQIKIGLIEAGDVFSSLAIPLTKLVGLKTTEMSTEGRFSTIVLDIDSLLERDRMGVTRSSSIMVTRNGCEAEDPKNQIHSPKEVDYAAKAEMAGKEIMEKKRRQLVQLVGILRHIGTQVNSREEYILQKIDHQRTNLQKFIKEAAYYISTLHSQNHDTFPVTVKLLRIIFNNISQVLGSVECGVEDLTQALAEKMCNPMAEYVNNLKAEIALGPCAQLMNIVNSMERARADTRRELEDARARIRLAENAKLEVLCRLRKTEEQVRRIKESLGFLPTSQKWPPEPAAAHKCLGIEGSQENDGKLHWELLQKKSKQQVAESPIGTKELIKFNPKPKPKPKPSVFHRPMMRSQTRVNPQTPSCSVIWIPLGSSPSVKATSREVSSSKRIKRF